MLKTIIVSLVTTISFTATAQQWDQDWEKFHQDPKQAMQTNPQKFDEKGNPVQQTTDSIFTAKQIKTKRYLNAKINSRNQIKDQSIQTPAHFTTTYEGINQLRGRVARFLDLREFQEKQIAPVFTLREIEQGNLLSATLPKVPWSDTYWPVYKGILGQRYSSPSFNSVGFNFSSYQSAVIGENSLSEVLKRNNPVEIEGLSPSEKYDLLIGLPDPQTLSPEGFLTPHMWAQGQHYFERTGDVETWMGICHGWAAASFMTEPPKGLVEVASSPSQEVKLQFYPSDIKGLISYLWANSEFESSFVGGRCNLTDAKIDENTGRILDPECFDVNPAVWHLAIVNQIGKAQRSFVMDAAFDYEVWNQPVVSYSIQYINPQTATKHSSFEDAKIALTSYKKDKFKKYRSPQTKEVVGVRMEVVYAVENQPNHDLEETEGITRTVSYAYDLEIDVNGELIGGEWYTQAHPDFLWLPRASVKVESYGDEFVQDSDWDLTQPLPPFWRQIAVSTAQTHGQPLARITELLVKQTRR